MFAKRYPSPSRRILHRLWLSPWTRPQLSRWIMAVPFMADGYQSCGSRKIYHAFFVEYAE